MFFRINPKATRSGDHSITADSVLFILKMLLHKEIGAPWYNNDYSTQIVDVTKYDARPITSSSEKCRENQPD